MIAGNAGATFPGRDGDADPGWSARTDAGGRFQRAPGETGRARSIYLVTAEGFAPRLEATDQAPETQVVLDKGSDLVIHLLTEKEEPVTDAQATLIPLSCCEATVRVLADLLIRSARADTDGTVEIRSVPDGVYALRLVAKGRVSSNLAPLVVGKGHSEFRIRLPRATPFRVALEIPTQTTRSPGTIVAFWNDPAGLPQWTEGRFLSGESSFELDGLPLTVSSCLLVRTENGLSSRWVRGEEVAGSRSAPGKAIPLRPPGSWEGQVEEGSKATSLLVEPVFPAFSPPLIRPEAMTVQVGPDGRFVVPDILPTAERLRIAAPGRGEAEVPLEEGTGFDMGVVRFQPRQTIQGSITWEDGLKNTSGSLISSAGAVLRLRVTRPGGSVPVRDLRIELRPGQEDLASGRKDGRAIRYSHSRDGTFFLHTPEKSPARVTVSVPGGGPKRSATVNVSSPGPPTDAALVLPEGRAVFGNVLAGETRNPVAGAEVEMGTNTPYRDQVKVARILHTAAEGKWRFEEVQEGMVRLSASAPGYSSAAKQASVPAETDRISQDLILQHPGRLQVRVLGLPKESKASLLVYPKTWGSESRNYQDDFVSRGQLVLENLRPDRYGLSLSVQVSTSAMLGRHADTQVRSGETAEVEFDLRKGITLSGRAYLGDKAIPGAKINFSKYSEETPPIESSSIIVDEQGRYAVVLPSAGRYILNMFDPAPQNRGKMIGLGRPVEIGAESLQSRDLRFADGRIRGRVVASDDTPIPDALIHISNACSAAETAEGDEGEVKTWEDYGRTGRNGSFEFGPLSSGDYVLETLASGFASRRTDSIPLSPDQILELQDIVLEPEMAFRVKAVDQQGLPLLGMRISAFFPTELDLPRAFGVTGNSGEADMKGLSPGTYTLIGLLRGWPPAVVVEVKVPPEKTSLPAIIQVGQGGELEIQVLDRSGSPVPDLRPRIIDTEGQDMTTIYGSLANLDMSPWMTNGEGRARLATVAPGDYSIQVGSGKKSDVRSVTISPGQTSRITFVIP